MMLLRCVDIQKVTDQHDSMKDKMCRIVEIESKHLTKILFRSLNFPRLKNPQPSSFCLSWAHLSNEELLFLILIWKIRLNRWNLEWHWEFKRKFPSEFEDIFGIFCSSTKFDEKSVENVSVARRLSDLDLLVRLFEKDLSQEETEGAFDFCLLICHQFVNCSKVKESNCREFVRALRFLSTIRFPQFVDSMKLLLGNLTQLLNFLDEKTASDIRMELLNLFSTKMNYFDDQDLGRLFETILTTPFEPNSSSIGFHFCSLDLIDAVRQRSNRTAMINDLLVQLIVRYGNENACSLIFKAHLIVKRKRQRKTVVSNRFSLSF